MQGVPSSQRPVRASGVGASVGARALDGDRRVLLREGRLGPAPRQGREVPGRIVNIDAGDGRAAAAGPDEPLGPRVPEELGVAGAAVQTLVVGPRRALADALVRALPAGLAGRARDGDVLAGVVVVGGPQRRRRVGRREALDGDRRVLLREGRLGPVPRQGREVPGRIVNIDAGDGRAAAAGPDKPLGPRVPEELGVAGAAVQTLVVGPRRALADALAAYVPSRLVWPVVPETETYWQASSSSEACRSRRARPGSGGGAGTPAGSARPRRGGTATSWGGAGTPAGSARPRRGGTATSWGGAGTPRGPRVRAAAAPRRPGAARAPRGGSARPRRGGTAASSLRSARRVPGSSGGTDTGAASPRLSTTRSSAAAPSRSRHSPGRIVCLVPLGSSGHLWGSSVLGGVRLVWPADALKPFAIPWDRWLPLGSAAASPRGTKRVGAGIEF